MKLIFAGFVAICLLGALSTETEANVLEDCWETWSRCSTWSSGLTGIAWQSCPQRCQCLGWETGTCEERPSKCPLAEKAWACICSTNPFSGPKPDWCGL